MAPLLRVLAAALALAAGVQAVGVPSDDPGWIINLSKNILSFAIIVVPAALAIRYLKAHPEAMSGALWAGAGAAAGAVVAGCAAGAHAGGAGARHAAGGSVQTAASQLLLFLFTVHFFL